MQNIIHKIQAAIQYRNARLPIPDARQRMAPRQLHIGCGPYVLKNWVNLDINPVKGAFFFDARRPFPFPDRSVNAIFHEHFIEHMSLTEARVFLKECARVLAPGAVMRVSTPDLELLIKTYQDANNFVAREHALARHQRLTCTQTPVSPAQFLNDKFRLWGHLFIYDRAALVQVLTEAGFDDLEPCPFGESRHELFRNLERHADVSWMKVAEPIIIEARRSS